MLQLIQWYTLLLFFYVLSVNCDLPIHVTTSDVIGRWRFEYSEPLKNWIDGCGSGTPNKNTQNLQPSLANYNEWLRSKTDSVLETMDLILTDLLFSESENNNLDESLFSGRENWEFLAVKDPDNGKIVGRWTMVYDEGFEIITDKMTIFAIMKYNLLNNGSCSAKDGDNETEKGETLCYETDPSKIQLGWYYIRDSKRRGCIDGKKDKNYEGTSGIMKARVEVPIKKILNSSIRSLSNSLQEYANRHNNKISKNWRARSDFSLMDVAFSHHPYYINAMNFRKIHMFRAGNMQHSSFIEISNGGLGNIENHNNVDPIFACNVIRRKTNNEIKLPSSYSIGDPFTDNEFNDFPFNQGNCGSCYAVSSVYVLSKRAELQLSKLTNGASGDEKISLSSQSVLSCSPFNQGCDGGYPFLVGRQAEEIGISTEKCMAYFADSNQECNFSPFITPETDDRMYCEQNERMFAKYYGYVGGCYGCGDEEKMKEEIFKNGPIVAAMHIDTSMLVYDNGIYDTVPDDHTKYCDLPNKQLNGWEYTNHAIVVVGWGEENGIPYWIIRNSWGVNWGKKGYAKVRRGKNIGGIENQAVFIDPDFSRGLGLFLLNKYKDNEQSDNIAEIKANSQGSEIVNIEIESGEAKE
ncbi:putative preprocathepsin c precursor [Cryptosporidium canis]|uniref:Dipeptidyl peptidase 1 n=1 Tax=Cryptosporidium canis TaxID=195482 RepID=A0A9D5HY42_9CRYT|nr:putative preprocathepsin c precursor [Cryptosporidium canis]